MTRIRFQGAVTISNSYFTQLFQQFFHTNVPTVISRNHFDRSPSCKFSIILIYIHFLTWSSNQAHVNLGILGANKLELSLPTADVMI